MPYSPDDDRYYTELHRAGDDYQKYRDRVSEEQSAHAREMGQLYGQMLPKALNAGMQGADWSMNRARQQQQYDQSNAQEQRAQEDQGFHRNQERRSEEEWGLRKPNLMTSNDMNKMALEKAQMEHAFNRAPVGSEETQKLGYKGESPLSRYEAGLLRGDRTTDMQYDVSKQSLANARQQAGMVAQQIAQNAQSFQNQQYQFEAQKATTELDDIYAIKDPKLQAQALGEWRDRNGSKLLGHEALSNMASGAGARREAQLAQTAGQRVMETKLTYGPAIQEAQQMTQKLNMTQQLAQNAKVYEQNASFGGLHENANAEDARQNAAAALHAMGNHAAADKVSTGMLAGARGILSDQARQQAQQTLMEFDDWYARQDNRVQQLEEVKRAYQQAQALKTQLQGGADAPTLRKVPSLVGGGGGPGQHTNANRSFMTGGAVQQQGAQYGQPLQQQPQGGPGFQLAPMPGPARPMPQQQAPMGPGQVPGADPYGLQRSQRQAPLPAGVSRGNRG